MGTCKLYTVPVAVYRVGMCATPHTPQGGFPSLSLYLGSRPAGPGVLCGRVIKYSGTPVHAPSTVSVNWRAAGAVRTAFTSYKIHY